MPDQSSEAPEFRAGYVALIGEPNVGKSTLLNAVLGQKLSIVTPKPQTTRHKILGIHSTEHLQIVFLDTPGIITPRYELHEAMMRQALGALNDADIVLFLVDASREMGDEAIPAFDRLGPQRETAKPIFLLINKCDLAGAERIARLRSACLARFPFSKVFMISALKGSGVGDLVEALAGALPVHPPYYPLDILSEQNQRFFVAEMIREKIFMLTHEEVPYAASVEIVDFKEREEGKWFISANVIVERESQKGILIGKGGTRLKQIGRAARADIERHLEYPVFLELHVKVREKWREKEEWVKRFGYEE